MQHHRILRRPDVEQRTGLARSTLYHLMSSGLFPKPIHIGPGAVGWLETEIDSYISTRVAERDRQGSL